MTRASTKASHPKADLRVSLKKEAKVSPPKVSSADDPYSHPKDFVWRDDGGPLCAKIAIRKPKGWQDDPAFDEGKYFEAYRESMIRDSMWVGA